MLDEPLEKFLRVKTADEVNSQVAIDEEDGAESRQLLKGSAALHVEGRQIKIYFGLQEIWKL